MEIKILTEKQTDFLKLIGKTGFFADRFYLTGGTALAAFYLQHRYSEDLDFFSEMEFDSTGINTFLEQARSSLAIRKIDYQQSFNRNLFFLHFDGEVLKTEFTFFPFSRIEKGDRHYNVETDSLLDVAVNKLFTIYQRMQARDYIDLYFICKERGFLMADLIQKARIKFDWHIDPLQLGTQFIKSKKASNYPKMIKPIEENEWQDFFINEASKLKDEILK